MSYSFDGSGDFLTGTFTSTYDVPITLACWFKYADHPVASDRMVMLGNSSSSNSSNLNIRTSSTDNQFMAETQGTGSGTTNANVVKTGIDATWTPFIGVFISDSSRAVYVSDVSDTGAGTQAADNVFQFIRLGTSFTGSNDFTGNLAEVSIWNKELSAGEIASYLAANDPSGIAAANLIGYWPLSSSNSTQSNLGVDTGGDLTVTSAVFDADHPAISGGGLVQPFHGKLGGLFVGRF